MKLKIEVLEKFEFTSSCYFEEIVRHSRIERELTDRQSGVLPLHKWR